MRVALLTHSKPATTLGGTERFILELQAELSKAGIDTEIVVPPSPRAVLAVAALPSLRGFHLIHAQQTLGWLAKLWRGPPFLTTLHGTVWGWLRARGESGPLRALYGRLNMRLERTACRHSSALVAVSERTRREAVEAYGMDADKITVIPNGIDTEKFRPLPYEGKRLPLCIGRIDRMKGIDLLEKAAQKLNEDVLVTGYVGESKRLKRIPFVPFERAPELYAKASVLLQPSRYEGYGLVILEALACGVPVVSFDVGAASELIENGKEGFIVPAFDTDAFAEAANRLLADEGLREQMGRNARKRAEHFTLEKMARRYASLYEKLL